MRPFHKRRRKNRRGTGAGRRRRPRETLAARGARLKGALRRLAASCGTPRPSEGAEERARRLAEFEKVGRGLCQESVEYVASASQAGARGCASRQACKK